MNSTLKLYYLKIAKRLPQSLVRPFEALPVRPFILLDRLETWLAIRSGPPYYPSHRKIIIDITTSCDLHCFDCNRSCGQGQAPSEEHMSINQIERFLRESVDGCRKWNEIILEGGEPTLHPKLEEIVELLLWYRKKYSPRTNIRILTNGYGKNAKKAMAFLPRADIDIFNTGKTSIVQEHHCAFNIAPSDVPEFKDVDFSQGCYLPACYGLGLTRHGYYPHPICGGIDRVFGFDIGAKHLPRSDDPMTDMFQRLCRLCGYFQFSFQLRIKSNTRYRLDDGGNRISETWQKAYEHYRQKKPILSEYE